MKFNCKRCGTTLTSDLFKSAHLVSIPNTKRYEEDIDDKAVKLGSFHIWKWVSPYCRKWRYTTTIVSREDCIGMKFKPFKSGYGCCDNCWIPVTCSGCGNKVGVENYDCYQSPKHVEILEKEVIRNYEI